MLAPPSMWNLDFTQVQKKECRPSTMMHMVETEVQCGRTAQHRLMFVPLDLVVLRST